MRVRFTVIAWCTISAAVTRHHHSPIRHSFPLWFLAGDSISISLSFYWFLGSLVQHGPILYQSSAFIDQKERKEEKKRDKKRKGITPGSWDHLWVSPVVRRIFSFGFKPFQDGRIPIDSEESPCPLWWLLLYFQAPSLFLFLLVRKQQTYRKVVLMQAFSLGMQAELTTPMGSGSSLTLPDPALLIGAHPG